MPEETIAQTEQTALNSLRNYAEFLNSHAPTYMERLIAMLLDCQNSDSISLTKAIRKIQEKHAKHENEVLAIIAKYESAELQRINTTENEEISYCLVEADEEFSDWIDQQKLIENTEPKPLEPDIITKE